MKVKIIDNFLLIDGDNLFHRIRHAFKSIKFITVIKHIRASLHFLEGRFLENSDKLIIVWDAGHSGRNKIFPDYKKNRQQRKTEKEIRKINKLKNGIRHALSKEDGYINFWLKGYEADDVIASFASLIKKSIGFRAMIISEDKDFLQIVDKRIVLFRPIRRREYSLSNFEKVTGLSTPKNYIKYLALMGDHVDGIPGLPGIGDKRAKLYLTAPEKLPEKIIKQIESSREQYIMYYKLVRLKTKIYKKHFEMKKMLLSLGVRVKEKEND